MWSYCSWAGSTQRAVRRLGQDIRNGSFRLWIQPVERNGLLVSLGVRFWLIAANCTQRHGGCVRFRPFGDAQRTEDR